MQRRRPERRPGTEGRDRSFVALFEVLGVRPEQTAAAVQAQWARTPVKVGRRGCAKVAPTLVTVAAVYRNEVSGLCGMSSRGRSLIGGGSNLGGNGRGCQK